MRYRDHVFKIKKIIQGTAFIKKTKPFGTQKNHCNGKFIFNLTR